MILAPIVGGVPRYAGITAKTSVESGMRIMVRNGRTASPRASAASVDAMTSMHSPMGSRRSTSDCERISMNVGREVERRRGTLSCLRPQPDEDEPGREGVEQRVEQVLERHAPSPAEPDRLVRDADAVTEERRCCREAQHLAA